MLQAKRRTGGRNNSGHITVWHRGGGHKRRIRLIDFKRSVRFIMSSDDSFSFSFPRLKCTQYSTIHTTHTIQYNHNTIQYNTIQYNTMHTTHNTITIQSQYNTHNAIQYTQCNTIQYNTHNTIQYTQYNTIYIIQCNTIQYTIQYTQYNTIQYNTITIQYTIHNTHNTHNTQQ